MDSTENKTSDLKQEILSDESFFKSWSTFFHSLMHPHIRGAEEKNEEKGQEGELDEKFKEFIREVNKGIIPEIKGLSSDRVYEVLRLFFGARTQFEKYIIKAQSQIIELDGYNLREREESTEEESGEEESSEEEINVNDVNSEILDEMLREGTVRKVVYREMEINGKKIGKLMFSVAKSEDLVLEEEGRLPRLDLSEGEVLEAGVEILFFPPLSPDSHVARKDKDGVYKVAFGGNLLIEVSLKRVGIDDEKLNWTSVYKFRVQLAPDTLTDPPVTPVVYTFYNKDGSVSE